VLVTVGKLPHFNVSNRHTFGLIFGRDLGSRAQLARTRQLAAEVVLRYIAPGRRLEQWVADLCERSVTNSRSAAPSRSAPCRATRCGSSESHML
jgi:hypothetical protein